MTFISDRDYDNPFMTLISMYIHHEETGYVPKVPVWDGGRTFKVRRINQDWEWEL